MSEFERARDKEFQNEIDTDGRCRAADWGYRYALLSEPVIKDAIDTLRAYVNVYDACSESLKDFDALVKRLEER